MSDEVEVQVCKKHVVAFCGHSPCDICIMDTVREWPVDCACGNTVGYHIDNGCNYGGKKLK